MCVVVCKCDLTNMDMKICGKSLITVENKEFQGFFVLKPEKRSSFLTLVLKWY